ncbi:glucokinase [Pochonia chlamydosporia 170]|uniref:Gluconokinase n=1 Tax=Pochonia chlamydosporia 170 TaxID=1380566 RepID=A0A179F1I9_METCM|nr:glucokinase [Pochonia chlamydosporia 170]OAQ59271.1 glucokinase [Pochonia chlamydosporia 170]
MTEFLTLSEENPINEEGTTAGHHKHPNHSWVLFVSGPTASGKSSVADFLATNLEAHFIEGDDLHPKANVGKMHKGEPLNDSDRQGWLEAISEQASGYEKEHNTKRHLIITCSALKRSYRELLRESCDRAGYSIVHFIHLDAPESELRHRAETRHGHFAKSNLVHSQFQTLERPGIEETDVTMISVVPPLEEVQNVALDSFSKILAHKKAQG